MFPPCPSLLLSPAKKRLQRTQRTPLAEFRRRTPAFVRGRTGGDWKRSPRRTCFTLLKRVLGRRLVYLRCPLLRADAPSACGTPNGFQRVPLQPKPLFLETHIIPKIYVFVRA